LHTIEQQPLKHRNIHRNNTAGTLHVGFGSQSQPLHGVRLKTLTISDFVGQQSQQQQQQQPQPPQKSLW
jgi:hypothetical protein